MIIAIRSVLFNLAFYINLILQMIIFLPIALVLPRKKAWFVPKLWARTNLFLQKHIAGTDFVVEGTENLPEGPYICAPKHQSFWDVYAFLSFMPDPVYILKRDLMRLPLFGWYLKKMQMIPVDRGSGMKALHSISGGTTQAIADDRQIMIYPEGTRRAPGAPPAYKYGIVHLYLNHDLPVVPIAHNAGLYWPRRKFMRYPGTIRCRILPPIESGLDKDAFLKRLIEATETACDDLLVMASKDKNPPPMPATAIQRLAELQAANSANEP